MRQAERARNHKWQRTSSANASDGCSRCRCPPPSLRASSPDANVHLKLRSLLPAFAADVCDADACSPPPPPCPCLLSPPPRVLVGASFSVSKELCSSRSYAAAGVMRQRELSGSRSYAAARVIQQQELSSRRLLALACHADMTDGPARASVYMPRWRGAEGGGGREAGGGS